MLDAACTKELGTMRSKQFRGYFLRNMCACLLNVLLTAVMMYPNMLCKECS